MTAAQPVAYAGRWDPQHRLLVEPLPATEAERRHTDVEPYVALFGRVDVLLESDGERGDLTVWCFDEHGRRDGLYEFRIVGRERMALLRMAQWRYLDGSGEFDRASPRRVTTFGHDGRPQTETTGPERDGWRDISLHDRWQYVPAFGEWAGLLRFVLGEPPAGERQCHGESPTLPGFTGSGLGPGPEVVAMFGPSRSYDIGDGAGPDVVTVETRPAGVLVLPTGRLVAGDPALLGPDVPPFAGTVPPGRNPVTVAGFDHRIGFVVTGCRIGVRDEPATVWEEALREGEEPSTEGTFHPIGVDTARIALLDAAALPGFLDEERRPGSFGLRPEVRDHLAAGPTAEFADPSTGTNVIAFRSGWGDGGYPVWLGRNDAGDVVCFVADTGVLLDVPPLG